MMAVFCIRKFDLHQHELQNTQAYVHICIQIQHVHVCSYLKKKKRKKDAYDIWHVRVCVRLYKPRYCLLFETCWKVIGFKTVQYVK